MSDVGSVEIAYPDDSARLFERLLDLPRCVFLDSAHPAYPSARYDILAAEPSTTLTTFGPLTRTVSAAGTAWSADDPLRLLQTQLERQPCAAGTLPFTGGAIGYFGYDLARRIERLPERAIDDIGLPDMAVGLYPWSVVVDHREHRAWLTGTARDGIRQRLEGNDAPGREPFRTCSELRTDMSPATYADAFARVQRYIQDGDCYQVNLARRFSVSAQGDPWSLYRHLRRLSPAPHSAYLHTPYGSVLSASPERFLRVRNTHVETRPIKGTRPRGADAALDQALAQELASSPKDRAENIMIVDLLRNDLGKTCATGSIKVPRLLEVETFSNVHHLVSTVTGQLGAHTQATDLLRGCFPGGSVTGAPKLRAMEIIEELEPHRRSIYCGAVGYLGYDGGMDTSIAIRTLLYRNGTAHFWAGGGLVADSEPAAEAQEILDKAQSMLKVLESVSDATTRSSGEGVSP